MMRRLTLAAAVVVGSGLLSRADEPVTPAVRTAEAVDVLEAQMEIKKATLQTATLDVRKARLSLERATKARTAGTGSAEELEQAKLDLDMATAQVDVRKAELREAEARLKGAKVQPAGAVVAAPQAKLAVFNMAAVMRDFDKAKYKVYMLNQERMNLSQALVKKRDEYTRIQKQLTEMPAHPEKEQMSMRMLELSRQIEDEDRKINKALNDEASKIISKLYDDIQTVVNEMAEENGYQVVFAYPDAVTPEERNSPYVKELKLKPPAAQPFFVMKSADITGDVIETLNKKYPALDARGKKVDMSKLNVPGIPPGPGKP